MKNFIFLLILSLFVFACGGNDPEHWNAILEGEPSTEAESDLQVSIPLTVTTEEVEIASRGLVEEPAPYTPPSHNPRNSDFSTLTYETPLPERVEFQSLEYPLTVYFNGKITLIYHYIVPQESVHEYSAKWKISVTDQGEIVATTNAKSKVDNVTRKVTVILRDDKVMYFSLGKIECTVGSNQALKSEQFLEDNLVVVKKGWNLKFIADKYKTTIQQILAEPFNVDQQWYNRKDKMGNHIIWPEEIVAIPSIWAYDS